jgi:hypothetical protein
VPDVEVGMHNGRPTVFIDGRPDALPGYSPGSSREFYDQYMPLFYAHGMGVYLVWVEGWGVSGECRWWSGDTVSATPLFAPPATVFTLDDQIAHIRQGDPGAYIIVRFYTRPPSSWSAAHPDEFTVTEDGTVTATPSLASEAFWDKAAAFGAALVRYCEAQPWGDRVIGYNTHYLEEGSHMPVSAGYLFDHSPLMLHQYRRFLQGKHATVERLREAHGDDSLTFETATVPRDRLRGPLPEVAGLHYWQNARDNQPLRDYLELTRDLWHRRLCRTTR